MVSCFQVDRACGLPRSQRRSENALAALGGKPLFDRKVHGVGSLTRRAAAGGTGLGYGNRNGAGGSDCRGGDRGHKLFPWWSGATVSIHDRAKLLWVRPRTKCSPPIAARGNSTMTRSGQQ